MNLSCELKLTPKCVQRNLQTNRTHVTIENTLDNCTSQTKMKTHEHIKKSSCTTSANKTNNWTVAT